MKHSLHLDSNIPTTLDSIKQKLARLNTLLAILRKLSYQESDERILILDKLKESLDKQASLHARD